MSDAMIRIINVSTGQETTREYTPDELAMVEQLRTVKTPLDDIVALEADKPFTHRALRELSLSVAQIAGMLTGQDPLTQPQIAAIAKLDSDIAKLRDQAKVQGLI